MYKTIRMLPAALLLLLGTACTNDPADNPAATGTPLVLEHVYIGTPTKATPYETTAFEEGDQLTANLTLDGVESTGTYIYNGTTWTASTPAYWHSSKEAHTLTLQTPEPSPAMPDAFTADNWHQYDILTYTNTQVTPGTTSFQLTHARAQLIVTLTPGTGLEGTDLSTATVKAGDSQLWHRTDQNAYYALIDPATSPALTITCNGENYSYTSHISLYANQCTLLALTLHKTGVSGISITSQPWEGVTATATEENGWTAIHCDGINPITIPDDATKLLITGTLTSSDISNIYSDVNDITDLYITASAENNEIWNDFNMSLAENLQSVYIAQATSIGEDAFANRAKLTSINLPAATNIGSNAFFGCTKLTGISLPKAATIGENAFDACFKLTSISLPEATDIGNGAFYSCDNLASISLPAATTIGSEAFLGCVNLANISLLKAATIGSDAFYFCRELTSINLPEATTIGDYAFFGCTKLTSISLPAATPIGSSAFYDCTSLTTLYLLDLTAEEFEADPEKYTSLGGVNWQHIYYGYKGTGDYLDKSNYTKVWERDTNP